MDVDVNGEEEMDGEVEMIPLRSTQPEQSTSVSSSSKGKNVLGNHLHLLKNRLARKQKKLVGRRRYQAR